MDVQSISRTAISQPEAEHKSWKDTASEIMHNPYVDVALGVGAAAAVAFAVRGKLAGAVETLFPKASELIGQGGAEATEIGASRLGSIAASSGANELKTMTSALDGTGAVTSRPEISLGSIHPTADIAESATIHRNAVIGEGAQISNGAQVGDGALIGPKVQLGENSTVGYKSVVGEGAVLDKGVILTNGVEIGANTRIGADTVIGKHMADGWINLDESGAKIGANVEIGTSVEIRAKSTIGDGAIIKDGVLLDHHVEVGNSAYIGKATTINHDVVISAGTRVGDRIYIPPKTVWGEVRPIETTK
jgi:UDP-3-O-[3-hydroxymyristoyl] glucosamine N-acyltransferase